MKAESLALLRPEFSAEEGTFLLKLRCDLVWDKVALARLLSAMLEVALKHNADEVIPKWVAEGFWYLDQFIPNWSQDPDFPREYSDEYYDSVYEVVHDLANFFFMGGGPYAMKTELTRKVQKLSPK